MYEVLHWLKTAMRGTYEMLDGAHQLAPEICPITC